MPLTTGRIQFHHGKSRKYSIVPERPPRHSNSSSNRSRSLEIIDQSDDIVQSNVLLIENHCKSLDKLLTDDKQKVIESYPSHQQDSIPNVSYIKNEKLEISDDFVGLNSTLNMNINLDNLKNNNKPTEIIKISETSHRVEKNYDELCPMPIPRQKIKSNKSELIKTEQLNSTMFCNSLNSSSSHCDKSTCSLNENTLDINIQNLTNKNKCKIYFDESETVSSCNSNLENITEPLPILMTNNEQQKNQNFINKCVKKMKSLINK